MRYCLFIITLLLFNCSSNGPDQPEKIEHNLSSLNWLEGNWKDTNRPRKRVYQEIITLANDSILGRGLNFKDSLITSAENFIISKTLTGELAYDVHVLTTNQHTVFLSDSIDSKYVRFSNFTNDFPQEIEYQMITPSYIKITITGLSQGYIPREDIINLHK